MKCSYRNCQRWQNVLCFCEEDAEVISDDTASDGVDASSSLGLALSSETDMSDAFMQSESLLSSQEVPE